MHVLLQVSLEPNFQFTSCWETLSKERELKVILVVCFVLYGSLVYSLTFPIVSFFSSGPCLQGPFVHPCTKLYNNC